VPKVGNASDTGACVFEDRGRQSFFRRWWGHYIARVCACAAAATMSGCIETKECILSGSVFFKPTTPSTLDGASLGLKCPVYWDKLKEGGHGA